MSSSHATALFHEALPANLLLSAIVDASEDAISSEAADGTIMSWNRAAERIFGYTAGEVMGQNALILVPPELQCQEPEIVARLQRGERIDHFETVRVRRDGRRIHVSLTISPLRDEAGRVIGASKIARDIDLRREADAAVRLLAAIVDSSDDAIVSKDLEGVVTSWNKGAQRIFGYTAQEMIGQPIAKLFPPDRLDEEPKILRRLRSGERVDHYQTIRVRKNGEHFPVSLTISPVVDGAGNIVGASKVARDVTKEMQAVEQLRLANEELKRADRMKSEFVAMMSHELRTPLNSILGFAGVLRSGRSGPLTEQQQSQLGLIQSSGKHLLQLINDLLDLSRIEAGKMELEIEEVPLADLVEEAVRSLEPQAHQKHLAVEVKALERPVVPTDHKRVLQVVLNVLNNAIKFTPRGHVTVTVTSDGGQAVVRVADTGIGIAAEQQAQLFQAFTQVDTTPRRRFEGTGLGLYLSRKILTALGGNISLQSEVNRGSTFTIALPLAPTPAAGPGAQGNSGRTLIDPHHP